MASSEPIANTKKFHPFLACTTISEVFKFTLSAFMRENDLGLFGPDVKINLLPYHAPSIVHSFKAILNKTP